MEKYSYEHELGAGGYGSVWRCTELESGKVVAVKRFKNAHNDDEVMRLALREVRLLKLCKHRNIIKLLEAFRSKSGRVYLVMEFIDRTLTADLHKNPHGLPPAQVKLFMWQLCQAIRYMHKIKLLHRDLKPANILVSSSGVVKLCDFGFARTLHPVESSDYSSYVVTRWYRPPEVLVGDRYGPPVDVWSLGCIFVELASGRPLLPGKSHLDQLALTLRLLGRLSDRQMLLAQGNAHMRQLRVTPAGEELPTFEKWFPTFTPEMIQVISGTLAADPAKRLTAEQLLELPYFNDIYTLLPQLAVMNAAAYGQGEDMFIPSYLARQAAAARLPGAGAAWRQPPPLESRASVRLGPDVPPAVPLTVSPAAALPPVPRALDPRPTNGSLAAPPLWEDAAADITGTCVSLRPSTTASAPAAVAPSPPVVRLPKPSVRRSPFDTPDRISFSGADAGAGGSLPAASSGGAAANGMARASSMTLSGSGTPGGSGTPRECPHAPAGPMERSTSNVSSWSMGSAASNYSVVGRDVGTPTGGFVDDHGEYCRNSSSRANSSSLRHFQMVSGQANDIPDRMLDGGHAGASAAIGVPGSGGTRASPGAGRSRGTQRSSEDHQRTPTGSAGNSPERGDYPTTPRGYAEAPTTPKSRLRTASFRVENASSAFLEAGGVLRPPALVPLLALHSMLAQAQQPADAVATIQADEQQQLSPPPALLPLQHRSPVRRAASIQQLTVQQRRSHSPATLRPGAGNSRTSSSGSTSSGSFPLFSPPERRSLTGSTSELRRALGNAALSALNSGVGGSISAGSTPRGDVGLLAAARERQHYVRSMFLEHRVSAGDPGGVGGRGPGASSSGGATLGGSGGSGGAGPTARSVLVAITEAQRLPPSALLYIGNHTAQTAAAAPNGLTHARGSSSGTGGGGGTCMMSRGGSAEDRLMRDLLPLADEPEEEGEEGEGQAAGAETALGAADLSIAVGRRSLSVKTLKLAISSRLDKMLVAPFRSLSSSPSVTGRSPKAPSPRGGGGGGEGDGSQNGRHTPSASTSQPLLSSEMPDAAAKSGWSLPMAPEAELGVSHSLPRLWPLSEH